MKGFFLIQEARKQNVLLVNREIGPTLGFHLAFLDTVSCLFEEFLLNLKCVSHIYCFIILSRLLKKLLVFEIKDIVLVKGQVWVLVPGVVSSQMKVTELLSKSNIVISTT